MMAQSATDEVPAVGLKQFVWLWNREQRMTTPALHADICSWLSGCWSTGRRHLLLMVFRDAGKSTLVGLYCAWLLSRNPNLRILVLAAETELACKMVRFVRRAIERHPVTRKLIPGKRDQWASDRFTVRRHLDQRDPSLLARGITGNITGCRADVVVCDDVEVPNTCDTPQKRQDLRERLSEIAYVLVPGGTQLFVGTPHSYYSIYADEPRPEIGESEPYLGVFDRLCIQLLDPEGNSRWPDRFTPEKIEEIRRQTGPAKFESQMMLRPVNVVDMRLDPDLMLPYGSELDLSFANGEAVLRLGDRRMASASCWWDPAYGTPDKGDSSVIAVVFVDQEGTYWLHAVRYLTHDPTKIAEVDEATQLCRQVATFAAKFHVPSITLETNGIGKFLPSLLRRELATARVGARVVEHSSSTRKSQRILDAFDPVLAAGSLNVHRRVWDTPFVLEMREWQPTGNHRDDGLDAVSGCLLSQPVRLRRGPGAPVPRWGAGQAPHMAAAAFDI